MREPLNLRVAIPFRDPIYKALVAEAQELGIDLEALLQFVLGAYATGRLQFTFSHQLGSGQRLEPIPGAAPASEGVDNMGFDALVKGVQVAMCASGALNCTQCLQQISLADFKKGACSKCEAPIESLE